MIDHQYDALIVALEELRDNFTAAAAQVDDLIREGKAMRANLAGTTFTDLGHGWRLVLVNGEMLYSAAWLNDGATAAKKWLDSRGEAA